MPSLSCLCNQCFEGLNSSGNVAGSQVCSGTGLASSHAIETKSFGEDENLNAEQVKAQIAQNPDLTPDDRQQMLKNLRVMVLANNRRVDITLSTTGQESTRRYPFNAKDFLALINTKGGETKSPGAPAAKKKPKQ
jgi:hypothetical protein